MPLLREESDALDALITRAKSLGNEQEVLTGRLREITRLRQEPSARATTCGADCPGGWHPFGTPYEGSVKAGLTHWRSVPGSAGILPAF